MHFSESNLTAFNLPGSVVFSQGNLAARMCPGKGCLYLVTAIRLHLSWPDNLLFRECNSTALKLLAQFGDKDSSTLKLAGQSHVRRVELGCT